MMPPFLSARRATARRAALAAGAVVVAASIAAAACADTAPPGPTSDDGSPAAAAAVVRCSATAATGIAACAAPAVTAAASPALHAAGAVRPHAQIVGGQNVNVRFEQMSFSFDASTRVLSSNVRLTNLMADPMGTADGTAPDPEGIQVFFHAAPTNGVSVVNEDGTGIFTGTGQPYFAYPGPMLTGAGATRTWQFQFPLGVSSFTFQLLLETDVAAGGGTAPPPVPTTLRAVPVVSGLSSPVYLTAPAGDPRLFIVQQGGTIRVVSGGQLLATPFLTVTDSIESGGERGLLSMAFHPNYAANGYFYVYYTARSTGAITIKRFRRSAGDPNVADPSSGTLVFQTPHNQASNHNGGLVQFGPDGMLWAGTGDGGGGGDPFQNGQNPRTHLGKLLRFDVDGAAPYAIPATNPYASGASGAREVWAIGLRNPWRWAFDRATGLLYIADVGQNEREEVDVVPATSAGVNYGWNIMEGVACYNATSCNQQGLTLPVLDYTHADGCSITGGFVYRGTRIPGLAGHYFYSDYCTGFLRSFKFAGGAITDRRSWSVGSLGNVTSFGLDSSGEMYILSANGTVYRLEP